MARWLIAAGLIPALISIWLVSRTEPAQAAGPCGTTHDAVDAEEQQFLTLLQAWRSTNGVSNEPVQLSGALNRAAAWFAEWQVTNGANGGHNDGFGRTWVQRAIDCGYTGTTSGGTPYAYGSGEGIYAVSGSSAPNVGPAAALQGMASHGGSGIYMSGTGSLPAKCYGVAVRRNGNSVAWVVVIAQYPNALACPAGAGGGATASPSTTTTTTPTPTATPSPTPTATPSPTPSVFRSWFSLLSKD